MRKTFLFLIIILLSLADIVFGQEIEWINQFGTPDIDIALGVVSDINGIYVVGLTQGILLGQSAFGAPDAFIKKYNSNGKVIWTRQFGTAFYDIGRAVSIDSMGNIYVVGETRGVFSGQLKRGGVDMFIRKYNSNGDEIWTKQFGTPFGDAVFGISIDAINSVMYITGFTNGVFPDQISFGGSDAFISKFNFNGDEIWTKQFGTSKVDIGVSIFVYLDDVYIAGGTDGELLGQVNSGGPADVFIRKYNSSGDEIWTRQFGTSENDSPGGIIVNSNGIYVGGSTIGTFSGQINFNGGRDAFIRRYDINGNLIWTRQFGSIEQQLSDAISFLATDSKNIYVVGEVGGTLPNQISLDNGDIFIRKYNSSGDEIWTRQFGTSGNEAAKSMFFSDDNIYIVGHTNGYFLNQINFGEHDAFIAKFNFSFFHFFSSIQNSSAGWLNLRKTAGSQNKPSDDVVKTLPNDWIIKVIKTMDDSGNNIDIDGYRWYQVEDKTDGAIGWIAAKDLTSGIVYLDYSFDNQVEFQNKAEAQLDTTDKRKPVILDAVNNYHLKDNADNSLYGGGGGKNGSNNFQKFIQGSIFPKELVLSIVAQESGGVDFDNEKCSQSKDGGIGIMQITSVSFKGLGSALDNLLHKNDCDSKTGWFGDLSKYYSNVLQGIYANIKDGYRVLQNKYRQKCPQADEIIDGYIFTCQDVEKILTVWGYNGFAKDKETGLYTGNYLKYISNKLKNLNSYFTNIIYPNNDNLIEKLAVADKNKQIIRLYSPGELQVVDSRGRITGLIDNEIKEEIPNSLYEKEVKGVVIFFPETPNESKYKVIGTGIGEYGLSVDLTQNQEILNFKANNIPISQNEIHEYQINWNKLEKGERGVKLNIDYDGNGIIDQTIISDADLHDIEPPKIIMSDVNSEYLLNSQLQIQFSATDKISGIASVEATLNDKAVDNNQIITLVKPGINTLKITAADNDGNVSMLTKTFNVVYNFGGFLMPMASDGSKTYNQGRVLPIKFQLKDVNNNFISTADAKLYVNEKQVGAFRYDQIDNQYVYNLATKDFAMGNIELKLILDDGRNYVINIQLKS